MTRIQAQDDQILVKRIDEKKHPRHGIVIPDPAQKKPQDAEAVTVWIDQAA